MKLLRKDDTGEVYVMHPWTGLPEKVAVNKKGEVQTAVNPQTGEVKIWAANDWLTVDDPGVLDGLAPLSKTAGVRVKDVRRGGMMQATDQGWQHIPGTEQEGSPLEAATRGTLHGGSASFSDEISGAVAAVTAPLLDQFARHGNLASPAPFMPSPQEAGMVEPQGQQAIAVPEPSIAENYRAAQQTIDARQDQLEEENPAAWTAGNLLGATVTAKPMLQGMQRARVPVEGAKGLIATGALTGALGGAGTADPDTILEDAWTGAKWGAGISLGTGTLFAGFNWVKNRGRDDVKMARIAQASGRSPKQLQRDLRSMGDDATLADTSNSFRMAGDVTASRMGEGAELVKAYGKRTARQFGEIGRMLGKYVGGGRDWAEDNLAKLALQKSRDANPLYRQSFRIGVKTTPVLRNLMRRPSVRKAIKELQEGVQDELDYKGMYEYLDDNGVPTLKGWNEVKKRLDARVNHEFANAKDMHQGIRVGKVRRQLLKELDRQNPLYAKARQTWSGAQQQIEMIEAGERFMSTPSYKLYRNLEGATESELNAFRRGAAASVEDSIRGIKDHLNAPAKFMTPEFRKKARLLIPDRRERSAFLKDVEVMYQKHLTAQGIGKNSQTHTRDVVERQLRGEPIGGATLEDVNSNFRLFDKVINVLGLNEKAIQRIGKMIMSADPDVQIKAFREINSGLRRLGQQQARARTGSVAMSNLAGQDTPGARPFEDTASGVWGELRRDVIDPIITDMVRPLRTP